MFAAANVLDFLQLFSETIILLGLRVYLTIYRQINKAAFKYELSASAAERSVFRKESSRSIFCEDGG